MKWFWNTKKMEQKVEIPLDGIIDGVVSRLTGELEVMKNYNALSIQVKKLKEQVADLEINKAKKQEEFDRKEREIEHKVGLVKKQQEMELKLAVREAKVETAADNLEADRKRFADEMQFQNDRFTSEVGYLKDMIGEILGRLPHVNVDVAKGPTRRTK